MSTVSRLANKTVLVTGATSGIGVEIARVCVEEGATVAVAGRNHQRGKAVAAELGPQAAFVPLDVSQEPSWQEAFDQLKQEFGRIDVLVNNAGIMAPGGIADTSVDGFQQTMMTNAGGVFLGCQYAIADMASRGARGSIVNVLSTTALKTSAWTLAYGASKAASLSLTKSVALHCAESGYDIRCNAVLPGVVMTPMVEGVVSTAPDREAALAQLSAQHPIGRMLEAREVAMAVMYFASDESSGVTGTHFAVDGGMTAA
ncbi:MAG: SDR family oxidoreductase [Pseudomonadota bacterium]